MPNPKPNDKTHLYFIPLQAIDHGRNCFETKSIGPNIVNYQTSYTGLSSYHEIAKAFGEVLR
jgi:hypothetical protein